MFKRLQEVSARGLERHLAVSLCLLYAAPCSQYPLRLGDASIAKSLEYDAVVKDAWGWLAGRPLAQEAWERACLPLALGGCGLQSAEVCRAPAQWAAWVSAIPTVSKALSLDDPTSVILQYGTLLEPLREAHRCVTHWAPDLPMSRTELHSALKVPVKQQVLMHALNEASRNRILDTLDAQGRAMFRSV